MKYNTTDRKLIEIFNIKNLQSVNITDFVSDNNSSVAIIPMLTITYDSGKVLTLSSKDKYFETFCKKVVEVYDYEKNSVSKNDPFNLHSDIIIDDKTREILESGNINFVNTMYKSFEDKCSYNERLFFQKDEVLSLMPIVKYHLIDFFKRTNKLIDFNDISGYRNNFVLKGNVNGLITNFLLTFDKINDSEYEFKFTGFDNKFTTAEINIKFSKNKIMVYLLFDKYKIESTSIYEIVNGILKEMHCDTRKDIPIYYENKIVEKCDFNSNISSIDTDISFDWFKLPWNSYFGFRGSSNNLYAGGSIDEIHYMYLSVSNNDFLTKEYYSRSYNKNETIVLDELLKSTSSIHNDDMYVIETSFLKGDFESGYYSEYLSSKNFYRAVLSNDVNSICDSEMKFLSKEDGIFDSADLFKSDVIKLARRD